MTYKPSISEQLKLKALVGWFSEDTEVFTKSIKPCIVEFPTFGDLGNLPALDFIYGRNEHAIYVLVEYNKLPALNMTFTDLTYNYQWVVIDGYSGVLTHEHHPFGAYVRLKRVKAKATKNTIILTHVSIYE